MTSEDVVQLAKLARIELSEAEVATYTKEMSAILAYVGAVKNLVAESASTATPSLGDRYNVFRADEVTNGAGEYTDAVLKEMPQTDGRYLVVKKILQTE
jgi:aspartyl-tRNA(Asn)/glutamyl-tRNA(Gln) amidotransferase subunit C